MVNLLPDEMKKEEEGEGFDQGIEERNSTEDKKDIPMTKPVQEISSSKKKSPAFWKKFRDFIFKKKSQEKKETKPVETTPLAQQETEVNKEREEEKKSQVSLAKKKEKHQKKEKKASEKSAIKNLGVSLMPEETMVISRVIRSRLIFLILSIVVISVLFILSRLYGNLYFEKKEAEVENIKRDIVLLEAQSKDFLEQRNLVIKLNDKAEEVERTLNQHIYWRNFFNFLENYTIADVYFGDFSAQAREPIRLNAQAQDLNSLARQIVAFREADDFVKKVEVSGVQKSGEGDMVQALLEITLLENIWQK